MSPAGLFFAVRDVNEGFGRTRSVPLSVGRVVVCHGVIARAGAGAAFSGRATAAALESSSNPPQKVVEAVPASEAVGKAPFTVPALSVFS